MLMLTIGILAFVLGFVVGSLMHKRAQETRCPRCRKSFAMREVSRETSPVSSYDTTTHVGLLTRDLRGNITETDSRVVPATAYIYNCVDECRFCGCQKETQRTRVYRK